MQAEELLAPGAAILRGNSRLRRLNATWYSGPAIVHWTMATQGRGDAWLSPKTYAALREVLLHMCAVYGAAVPVFCLMPDHIHLLCSGMRADCDQLRAIRFFRRHSALLLQRLKWQRQAYDHVLRGEELSRSGFQSVAQYILDNPVRAGLADKSSTYDYTGCVLPGKPGAAPFAATYWEEFWDFYVTYGCGRTW
jgi:putative transposase